MKKLILLALLVVSPVLASASEIESVDGPVFDVCNTQVRDYVQKLSNGNITSVRFVWKDSGRHGSETLAWVKTDSCIGYYVVRVAATHELCESAHYGTIPNYVHSGWTTGDCK